MLSHKLVGYYRSVIIPAVQKVKKMDADQAHEWVKKKYFGGKSTTLSTNAEFSDKMKHIREVFSKIGVWIPKPNENDLPPNF